MDLQSLLDLLRLTFALYTIILPGNPIRKSMIEMRDGVSGTYKVILFCSELSQAERNATELARLAEACSRSAKISIKRGCSEFAASFPKYKEASQDALENFSYPQDWEEIESQFDAANPYTLRRVNPSMPYLALHDLCIVRKWLDYAEGLGDTSLAQFSPEGVSYPHVEREGKSRRANL